MKKETFEALVLLWLHKIILNIVDKIFMMAFQAFSLLVFKYQT